MARGLPAELRLMAPRLAMRAAWFLARLLLRMEARLNELHDTGETLPFTVSEWRESMAYVREMGDLIPWLLEDAQEEMAVRAWVQTLLDELQGHMGRRPLRQLLAMLPGEEIRNWADREAHPWARLHALEESLHPATARNPLNCAGPRLRGYDNVQLGGATGSGEPIQGGGGHPGAATLDSSAPDPGGAPQDAPASPSSERNRRAFQALLDHACPAEDEGAQEAVQPEAEPEGREETADPGAPEEIEEFTVTPEFAATGRPTPSNGRD